MGRSFAGQQADPMSGHAIGGVVLRAVANDRGTARIVAAVGLVAATGLRAALASMLQESAGAEGWHRHERPEDQRECRDSLHHIASLFGPAALLNGSSVTPP